jgi:hypothetical protein
MKSWFRAAVGCASLVALATGPASAFHSSRAGIASIAAGSTSSEASAGWIVDRTDNICGLDDAKMLSKPAKVDYDALLRATPEMKKIKDDKIDPNSPQGIQLRQSAVTRVQTAAEKVRVANGHCSVWKAIRHTDGRTVSDVTEAVKAQL